MWVETVGSVEDEADCGMGFDVFIGFAL